MTHIIAFMNRLLNEFYDLESMALRDDKNTEYRFEMRRTQWLQSARQVLEHAGLESFLSAYETIVQESAASVWVLSRTMGIIASAKDCLESKITGKLKYLLHAEMFDSLIAQAKGLHETGHLIPAAVLSRIVIERWLRDQAEKIEVDDWQTVKASVLNDALKSASVYSTPKWRQIQSLLDVGNAAAHGDSSGFNGNDVLRMITFVESNCV